jgi:hypothetical protein
MSENETVEDQPQQLEFDFMKDDRDQADADRQLN